MDFNKSNQISKPVGSNQLLIIKSNPQIVWNHDFNRDSDLPVSLSAGSSSPLAQLLHYFPHSRSRSCLCRSSVCFPCRLFCWWCAKVGGIFVSYFFCTEWASQQCNIGSVWCNREALRGTCSSWNFTKLRADVVCRSWCSLQSLAHSLLCFSHLFSRLLDVASFGLFSQQQILCNC